MKFDEAFSWTSVVHSDSVMMQCINLVFLNPVEFVIVVFIRTHAESLLLIRYFINCTRACFWWVAYG